MKQARLKAKLSQKKLGLIIGIDEGSASPRINQYEKGRHAPDVKTLKLIADTLRVPLHYFYCEDEVVAELALKLNQMTEDERNYFLQISNELLTKSLGEDSC